MIKHMSIDDSDERTDTIRVCFAVVYHDHYFTTKFTIRPGTAICLTICLSPIAF
ncbi:hypothetical protein FHS27_000451 [Rhodopirellula rubra]|uniref:Uncharacterized protein n=1 Tax=Aporhodopirellula rubra TaxID=980271 RepID=A0A7W5DV09_9BACT|nr:hypothetical protein [Aporhodopirellula rubra]